MSRPAAQDVIARFAAQKQHKKWRPPNELNLFTLYIYWFDRFSTTPARAQLQDDFDSLRSRLDLLICASEAVLGGSARLVWPRRDGQSQCFK